ncbi:hypothetical protein B0H19DRAFT_1236936 [Mycena capillaripes]|nr:hypothetical protein B0H19DRAFT_1236936 [Mycena capillaripes]
MREEGISWANSLTVEEEGSYLNKDSFTINHISGLRSKLADPCAVIRRCGESDQSPGIRSKNQSGFEPPWPVTMESLEIQEWAAGTGGYTNAADESGSVERWWKPVCHFHGVQLLHRKQNSLEVIELERSWIQDQNSSKIERHPQEKQRDLEIRAAKRHGI